MTIVKTQDKPLNLNITLEEEIIEPAEPENNTSVVVNPEGRIIIGNQITAKKVKKRKETYTIIVAATIKGYFNIQEKKESLKELKISVQTNVWINKILDNGEPEKQINVTGENLAKIKPLIVEVVKDIILEYKNSYEFYKRLREDVDFFIKFEHKENEKLLNVVKSLLAAKTEEIEDAPLP